MKGPYLDDGTRRSHARLSFDEFVDEGLLSHAFGFRVSGFGFQVSGLRVWMSSWMNASFCILGGVEG